MIHLLMLVFGWNLLGQAISEENKLLFVQIIFRHGDRAPLDLYPTDPNPASSWPEGLAALTALGKRQQYALGKYFRSRYQNFSTSSPLEVNVLSSEVDRCLKSAETNMASFYAPGHEWSFDLNVPWQPISIRYLPENKDKYLETSSECPRASEEQNRIFASDEGQRVWKKHEEMFRSLSNHSGSNMDNWRNSMSLFDILFIEKRHNLTIPSWVESCWEEFSYVFNLSFFWMFNSPLLHRLRAGPLIGRIIETMNRKLNDEIPTLKFQIYSAHDSNIAVVLSALNLYNMIQPPYSSALLFELYEMPDGVKTVRIVYQNSSKPEEIIDTPQVLILDGCTEFCPLDYFIKYARHLIPEDWNLECQLEKSLVQKMQDKKVTIAWFLVPIAIVMAVMSIFILWRRLHSRKQDKYAYHFVPGNGISSVKYGTMAGP